MTNLNSYYYLQIISLKIKAEFRINELAGA